MNTCHRCNQPFQIRTTMISVGGCEPIPITGEFKVCGQIVTGILDGEIVQFCCRKCADLWIAEHIV